MNEITQLAREFSTSHRKLRTLNSRTAVDVSPLTRKVTFPTLNELRLQHHLGKFFDQIEQSDVSFEEGFARACAAAQVTVKWATGHLKSKKYKRWEADRWQEVAAREGLTQGYLAEKIKRGIEGLVKYDDSQKFCIDQATRRVWPEVSKIEQKIIQEDASSMDELLKARDEVDDLEKKLRAAVSIPTSAVPESSGKAHE